MIRFYKADYCDIEVLRNKYFSTIYEAQELFLELIVKQSDYYIIKDENVIGYCIMLSDQTLVEYFVANNEIKHVEQIFKKVIEDLSVKRVYCKSFDSILLKCCLNYALSYKIEGLMFRDFYDTRPDRMAEFNIRKAIVNDIPNLLQYTDELYESEEELYLLVMGGNIFMYHLESQLIGCGFLIRTMDNRMFYDIGMWVNSAYRRKGFATRIVAHLKEYCLENNMVPICGCAVDNQASRKTLEKNGFFSKHDLIEFTV